MNKHTLNSTWFFNPTQVNSVAISDDGSRCVFGSSFERGSGNFYTYLMDGSGNELNKWAVTSGESYQGVFWVDISGDGAYVASGGETSSGGSMPGFLQAFDVQSGAILLDVTRSDRINQVSLSVDGQYLAVCYGKTVEIFQLQSGVYVSIYLKQFIDHSINSCVISRDGNMVVTSGIKYDDTDNQTIQTTGTISSLKISGSGVTPLGQCTLSTGCMRVAITEDGSQWAASLHDGSCVLIHAYKPDEAVWHYQPENPNISLAYAVAITKTENDEVFIACGANQNDSASDGGFLYMLKSIHVTYEEEEAVDGAYPPPFKPALQWSTPIQYGVNPGVSMDKNATYVTATDGKPKGQTVHESAGNFYLFEAATGNQVWQQSTDMMNWPMMLSRNGQSAIGGSDNGSIYYWDLSTQ